MTTLYSAANAILGTDKSNTFLTNVRRSWDSLNEYLPILVKNNPLPFDTLNSNFIYPSSIVFHENSLFMIFIKMFAIEVWKIIQPSSLVPPKIHTPNFFLSPPVLNGCSPFFWIWTVPIFLKHLKTWLPIPTDAKYGTSLHPPHEDITFVFIFPSSIILCCNSNFVLSTSSTSIPLWHPHYGRHHSWLSFWQSVYGTLIMIDTTHDNRFGNLFMAPSLW